MTELMEKPATRQQEAFDQWLEALRSGEYERGGGYLRRKYPDGNVRYCCIGVLDEAVFNTTWEFDDLYGGYRDEDGFVFNLASNSHKIQQIGLDTMVTEEEAQIFKDYDPFISVNDSRLAALAQLNDVGVDFDTIAMLIETLDWRNK